MKLTKAGSNWVDGNRFYNRDIEREMCRRLRQLVHITSSNFLSICMSIYEEPGE